MKLIIAYLLVLVVSYFITYALIIKSICYLQLQGVWTLENGAMMITFENNKLTIAKGHELEVYDFDISYKWKFSFLEHNINIKTESDIINGKADLYVLLGVLKINDLTFYRDSKLSVDYMQ